ncbi:MAG TPA: HAMP domain-containing sensor histidine kinase [Gemmataceae bacterium]|nr:HAMP domain-containing sensor histidine kinase [Gemmataceae bacterium]
MACPVAWGPEKLAYSNSTLLIAVAVTEDALSKAKVTSNKIVQQQGAALARQEEDLRQRVLALAENERRYSEFLGLLAHELRTPLAPIRNSLHVVKVSCSADADVQESLGIIERQLHVFIRLIDDLQEVSRIARGRIQLHKERTGLAEVVQSAVKTCRADLDAAEQQLSVELPSEPIYVEADASHLGKAFAMLLHNAARYSEPGGHVTVRSEVGKGQVFVHVIDTGIGIDPAMLSRIFDLFRQLNDPRAPSRGGLGIGLTLAKGIVMLHGGAIEAHSDGAGKGSDFVVTLPLIV